MTEYYYGNVKKPDMLVRIVAKPGPGWGYTLVAPRYQIGLCRHITDGVPGGSDEAQIEWYQRFFGVGGERVADALVDFVIATGGTIGMLNDPFGTRMPWANGGSDGLEGDGPAFVISRGVFGINGELASVEHVAKCPNKMTSAQLESTAKLGAYYSDGAGGHPRGSKIPYDQYPYNPNPKIECVTDTTHDEFATKPCPCAGIKGQVDEYQALQRGIMRAGQTKLPTPAPDPTPGTPTPALKYPSGMSKSIAVQRWGKAELYRPGKEMSHFGFNETRPICLAWLERGRRAGFTKPEQYPSCLAWFQYGDAATGINEVVTFSNGWTLVRLSARAAWDWLYDERGTL